MAKKRVLFLCTGNACRSQMAEGFLRHLGSDRFEALSAGTHPSGLHPITVGVMAELGIDISAQRSKSVAEFLHNAPEMLVTVCSDARGRCPGIPGVKETLHWDIPDPISLVGSDEEVTEGFRRVRDMLQGRVQGLVRKHAK